MLNPAGLYLAIEQTLSGASGELNAIYLGIVLVDMVILIIILLLPRGGGDKHDI